MLRGGLWAAWLNNLIHGRRALGIKWPKAARFLVHQIIEVDSIHQIIEIDAIHQMMSIDKMIQSKSTETRPR